MMNEQRTAPLSLLSRISLTLPCLFILLQPLTLSILFASSPIQIHQCQSHTKYLKTELLALFKADNVSMSESQILCCAYRNYFNITDIMDRGEVRSYVFFIVFSVVFTKEHFFKIHSIRVITSSTFMYTDRQVIITALLSNLADSPLDKSQWFIRSQIF